MVSVGAEAITKDLRDNWSAALHGMLITLKDHCCSAAAGHKAVAVTVKRTARRRGIVFACGEGRYTVKRPRCRHIHFLCAAADHHVLEAVLDKEGSKADSMRATGTCTRNCEVDALEAEDNAKVHGNSGVHALEDSTSSAEHCVVLLDDLCN